MGQDRYVPALSLPPNNKARITHSYPATTNCKAEMVAFQIYQEVKRCALNRIPTKLLNKYGNVYSDVVYSIWLVSVYISGYLSSPSLLPLQCAPSREWRRSKKRDKHSSSRTGVSLVAMATHSTLNCVEELIQ